MAQENLIDLLRNRGLFLATAESLTGGLLGAEITAIPGSSDVYLGGVVAYQNRVKEQLLGVSANLLSNQGAVDPEVASQLAIGVRSRLAKANQISEDKVIGVSTTGVAGPGSNQGKLAGTVFIGLSSVAGESVYAFEFSGGRSEIRAQTVQSALKSLREQIQLISGY